ncbi:hypothetical protein KP509_30G073400 [Ceratopteris richardii]|uniref:Aminotransferase class I/classII large domain-containing protein n=1 Tax=Ceratopteris richardii TaxID=49495 RepID=A0A8T2R3T3_CERRI|nr:hypothetical protein KP509_30G073400 [Ceratopteris richardii]
MTGLHFSSPIAPIVLHTEESVLAASRALMLAGFHVSAIRPPTVPKHSSRLRITLTAVHTTEDVEALAAALAPWIKEKNSYLEDDSSKFENRLTRPQKPLGYTGISELEEKTLDVGSDSRLFRNWVTDNMRAKL